MDSIIRQTAANQLQTLIQARLCEQIGLFLCPRYAMPFENMPPQGPGFNFWALVLAFLLAFWGGSVSFFHRVRRGKLRCSLKEFTIEIFTSLFAGMIVFAIALAFNVNPYLAGAFSGLGGHAGARTIFLLQDIVIKKLQQFRDSA